MNIPKHTYYTLPTKERQAFWAEWVAYVVAFLSGYYAWFYLFPFIFSRPYPKLTLVSEITVAIIAALVAELLYKPLGRLLPATNTAVLYSLDYSDGNRTYLLVRGRYLYGSATGTIYTTEETRELALEELLETYPEAYVTEEGKVELK